MKKLSLIDKAFVLKRTPLFSELDLDLILTIADKLGISVFEENETVFLFGDEATKMYFVVKGQLQLFDEEGQAMQELKPLDFFGDEALFNERPRYYTVKSMTESTLLTLSRTNLLTIISECPSVAVGLLQVYSSAHPLRARTL